MDDQLDHDAHVQDYRHQGIPRDANGVPIFLILPAALQAQLDEDLAQCEAAWREGEPLAVAEAVTLLRIHRQPNPMWLDQAVVELAIGRRTKGQATRHLEAMKRLVRYRTVRDLKIRCVTAKDGSKIYERVGPDEISWEEAHERAFELLKGTLAAGSARTMKEHYGEVQRDLNEGRSGLYFNLKDRRYRDNKHQDSAPGK
jgi:hypothetical protein